VVRDPEVGGAGVEDDVELLGRGADGERAVVLRVGVVVDLDGALGAEGAAKGDLAGLGAVILGGWGWWGRGGCRNGRVSMVRSGDESVRASAAKLI
jgi:hypothetical protein